MKEKITEVRVGLWEPVKDGSKVFKNKRQLESFIVFNTVLLKQQKQVCERDPQM